MKGRTMKTIYLSPESTRHWTRQRYWRKQNHIAQTLLSCSDDGIPDLIALCEVENDSVLNDLTHRSLLRHAGYEYVMTSSPDLRGIDVALVYSPFSFSPIRYESLRVVPVEGMRPTRDILYVAGRKKTIRFISMLFTYPVVLEVSVIVVLSAKLLQMFYVSR